ncbi:MAG: Serine/threonine-protein kinase PknD [Phycisphaerae bacterium]|nr:Serine/threonine-protein kinase PknD [Phycisphaerae bacterium]
MIAGRQYTFKHGDRPLEGFVIQRAVGRGGFGEVYYATSDGGKEVALKYLRDHPLVEIRGVTHVFNLPPNPHLIGIHDLRKNAAGEWFVIMDYVAGPSLRDLLNSPDGLGREEPPDDQRIQRAAFFLRGIAKGLAHLHDHGIVHRDLKPANIFYDANYVKIADYGLSKAIAVSQHSGQSTHVGTVHYMAPDVGSGDYNQTIDIYALGVVLYEMLMGHVPYRGASAAEILMKHLTAEPEVDRLPEPFPRVIRKALAKTSKDRYQAVGDMIADVFGNADLERSANSFDPAGFSLAAARAARIHPVAPGAGSSNLDPLPAACLSPVDIGSYCSRAEERERRNEAEALTAAQSKLCVLIDQDCWIEAFEMCGDLLRRRPADPGLLKTQDFIRPRYHAAKQQAKKALLAEARARRAAIVKGAAPWALLTMAATLILGMLFGYGAGAKWRADSSVWVWSSSPVISSVERASLPALTVLAVIVGIIPTGYGVLKVQESRSRRGFFDKLFNFSANFDEGFESMAWLVGGVAAGLASFVVLKLLVILMSLPVTLIASDLSPARGMLLVGASGALLGFLGGGITGTTIHLLGMKEPA